MRLSCSNNNRRRLLHRWFLQSSGWILPHCVLPIIDFEIYGLSVLLRHVPPSFKVLLIIVNTSPGIVIYCFYLNN